MKPQSKSGYSASALLRAKATCLSIAQALGEDLFSKVVVVGGLVPALLYQSTEIPILGAHVGTLDLDLAMDLVVLDEEQYETIEERLISSGFSPDAKETGKIVRQRWRSEKGATVDFLLPPVPPDTEGAKIQSLTAQFAAITMRGLDLALKERIWVHLDGVDLETRRVQREIPVCPPHVFVALKALAMDGRDEPKDAYDLYFALAADAKKPEGLGQALGALRPHDAVGRAIESISKHFATVDSRGPKDVCRFVGEPENTDLAGDVLGFATAFLEALD